MIHLTIEVSISLKEAHLVEEGLIQEDHQREHQHGGPRGQAPEAGRGDSHEQGGEEELFEGEPKEDWRKAQEAGVSIQAWEGVPEVDNHPDAVYADKWEKHVKEVDKYKCGSCGRLACGCDHY